jgi:RNA polymerase sigma-70 factor (ECF subfamily)
MKNCNPAERPVSEDEDLEVVKRVVAGDTAAYGLLVEKYSSRVARYLWNNFGCHDDVEDALQEVFVTVLESLHTFRGEAKFSTWLYSVTANYCRNRRKKEKRIRNALCTLRERMASLRFSWPTKGLI